MNLCGRFAKRRTLLRALRNSVVVIGFYGVLISGFLWAWSFWSVGDSPVAQAAGSGDGAQAIGGFLRSDYIPWQANPADSAYMAAGTAAGVPLVPSAGTTAEVPLVPSAGTAAAPLVHTVKIESSSFTGVLVFDPPWDFSRYPVALKLRRCSTIDGLVAKDSDNYGWIIVHDDTLYPITGQPILIDGYAQQSLGDWDASGNPILGWVETCRIKIPAGSKKHQVDVSLKNHVVAQKFATRHFGTVIDPRNQKPVAGALIEITNPRDQSGKE